ncbi:MAG TPA: hypothetical protein VFV50_01300, partial [Bdellovibrionales bacterium]|nr:hypothetical protein [Bdellovibrionales bacterium]
MASLLVTVSLVSARPCPAAPAAPARETYKDLITAAQNLSLQKDRLQATQILTRALQKEKSLAARKELLTSLGELSEVFYTEKAQHLFELGESLRFDQPALALERYSESLKLEPGNISVLRAMARAQLALGACDRVSETAAQGLELNPYSEELLLLRAQALSCLFKTKDSKLVLDKADTKKSPLRFYFEAVKIQNLVFEDKLGMAEEDLKKLIEQDPAFPESYYWMGQIKMKQKAEPLEWNQKYVRLCQALTPATRRKYVNEPRLCLERKNVEQQIEQLQTGEST